MIVEIRTYRLKPGTGEGSETQETAFYGSAAWRHGPRAAVMSRIDGMHTVVLEAANPTALAAAHQVGRR